jgi:hypothetical protein
MTALDTSQALDLTIYVGQEQELLGVNVQITQDGMKGWYGGGVPVRRQDEERLGEHGVYSEPGKRGPRLVTVTGIYWADSPAEAAAVVDDLNGILAEGTRGALTVVDPHFGTRWANCYLTGTPDVSWDGTETGTFSFDLICPDPRKYGNQATRTTGIAQGGGGIFTEPMFGDDTAPGIMYWGDSASTGMVSFTNTGTADVAPFFRVDGWFDNFTITEIETGRRLKYQGEVLLTNWLELDAAFGTVDENGTTDRSEGLTIAEWPSIPGKSTRTYLIEAVGVDESLFFQMSMTAAPAWW